MKRKAKRINPSKLKRQKKPLEIEAKMNSGFGYNIPPDDQVVKIYFDQKDLAHVANDFLREYKNRKWKTVTGKEIKNWKVVVSDWIFYYQQSRKLALRRSRFCSQSI